MTGFTTGIALQIVVGVLGDATGHAPEGSNTLVKLANSLVHAGSWQPAAVAVSTATVAVWALARWARRLKSLATLVALVVVTAGALLVGADVERVGDIAGIPHALPLPVLPDPRVAPQLLVGAIAVALVALAQAAGIAAAVPNPDGPPDARGTSWPRGWPTSRRPPPGAAGRRVALPHRSGHQRRGPDAVGGDLRRPVAGAPRGAGRPAGRGDPHAGHRR